MNPRRVFGLWAIALLCRVALADPDLNCVEELLAMPEDEQQAVYLEMSDKLGVPSSVATIWLTHDQYQERYEGLLHAAYLLQHENTEWYRELHYRLYGTTKYAAARWRLRLYDWIANRQFLSPRPRPRGQSLADALRAADETLPPWIVEQLAGSVERIPSPSYFISLEEWKRIFDAGFADAAQTANGVSRAELNAFGPTVKLRSLLTAALPKYHRTFQYTVADRGTFESAAKAFAAREFPHSPNVAAALVFCLKRAHEATLPPDFDVFRKSIEKDFIGVLRVEAAQLLRVYGKERRAQSSPPPTAAPTLIFPAEVLPPSTGSARTLSRYRRKLLNAEGMDLPTGNTPLENVAFALIFSDEAQAQMDAIETDPAKEGLKKQVRKALLWLATNQKHPGLQSHRFEGDTWVSYVQNRTASAYRVLWRYAGRTSRSLEILKIIPHY